MKNGSGKACISNQKKRFWCSHDVVLHELQHWASLFQSINFFLFFCRQVRLRRTWLEKASCVCCCSPGRPERSLSCSLLPTTSPPLPSWSSGQPLIILDSSLSRLWSVCSTFILACMAVRYWQVSCPQCWQFCCSAFTVSCEKKKPSTTESVLSQRITEHLHVTCEYHQPRHALSKLKHPA